MLRFVNCFKRIYIHTCTYTYPDMTYNVFGEMLNLARSMLFPSLRSFLAPSFPSLPPFTPLSLYRGSHPLKPAKKSGGAL